MADAGWLQLSTTGHLTLCQLFTLPANQQGRLHVQQWFRTDKGGPIRDSLNTTSSQNAQLCITIPYNVIEAYVWVLFLSWDRQQEDENWYRSNWLVCLEVNQTTNKCACINCCVTTVSYLLAPLKWIFCCTGEMNVANRLIIYTHVRMYILKHRLFIYPIKCVYFVLT